MDSCDYPFLKGCLTGASLIIAIGAQNAFVLKQGILKNHVFVTALFCSLVDSLMIGLGVGGLGALLSSHPVLLSITRYAGIAFLLGYGGRSFYQVFTSHHLRLSENGPAKPSLKQTLLILSALGFLNPHVYIDTVMLLGSIGAQIQEDSQIYFALGAILASWIWFFTIAYGARFLAPYFEKPSSWKLLDFITGCLMWFIAYSLIFANDACFVNV